jgi:hypothetical protein
VSLFALGVGREAGATRKWCRIDPVIQIDGQIAHIFVAAFVKNKKKARELSTGPIKVTVVIPMDIDHKDLHGDNGFGHGYEFSLISSPDLIATADVVPVRMIVNVPMSNDEIAVRSWLEPKGRGRLRWGGGLGTANVDFSYDAPE